AARSRSRKTWWTGMSPPQRTTNFSTPSSATKERLVRPPVSGVKLTGRFQQASRFRRSSMSVPLHEIDGDQEAAMDGGVERAPGERDERRLVPQDAEL